MTECINTISNLKELTLETISNLKELTPDTPPCVMVQGYHKQGDGGDGIFFWDSSFNVDLIKFPDGEDYGTTIKPNFIDKPSKLGRWRREFTGPVDIRWFGASTTIDDNSDAIQRAIDTCQPVYIPYSGPKNAAFKFAERLKLRPGTVITGGGRTVSILEFTGCGIAIDDVDYGPATRSILYGFKLQAADPASTIGIQMTNAKVVVLENLWIEGALLESQRAHWSIAGLSIRGGQGIDQNTYDYRVLGCDISGCRGDGILINDDAGTGGLYVFHCRIQGCGGIGFNQVFGANGPGYKCQVYVEGNDIEGNSGGQIKCDSLCGSTFKNNHLENSRPPAKSATIPPMSFGSRSNPETSAGTTTGKNSDFLEIVDGDILILKVDGGADIQTKFKAGDQTIAEVAKSINLAMGTTGSEKIAFDSGGQLKLTSTRILDLYPLESGGKKKRRLTQGELQKSQVVVGGSSCVLRKLGLLAGIYNAHYVWNGQFFGLSIKGNAVNSVYAKSAIEFPSASGSVGIVVSGNLISGECHNRDTKGNCLDETVAAIVSHSQINIDISGNSCVGVFEGKDYAGIGDDWLESHNSFRGQDRSGHEFLGDVRFGITVLNDSSIIDSHSYTFHIKTANMVTFTLPDHKIGKRFLFKNIGNATAILISTKGTFDGMPTYTLPQYSFVELQDDGIDYWIIGSGRGGSSLVEGSPP